MMNTTAWQKYDIRLLAVAASLLLSCYTVLFPGIPNDDAYTYVRTADIFLQQGLSAAIEHYTWAGYSILIALLSQLGMSLFTAAFVLNALLFALLVYSFISIVKELDDSPAILMLAALVVLVYPELNEYRELIIRDIGFWAFSLVGLWQFLVFYRSYKLVHGVYFCLALGIAMLFRIESSLYLLLTPLSLLFNRDHAAEENRKILLQLLGIIVAFGLAGFVLLFAMGLNLLSLAFEFVSVYKPFFVAAFNPSEADIVARSNAIFGEFAADFSQDYVGAVITVGLLVVLFMTLFYAISGPYFWLLAYACFKKQLVFSKANFAPITTYLLTNAVILIIFLYITRYLTGRYALMFGLMMAIHVPFVVMGIMEKARGKKSEQATTYFLIFFFAFCAVDAYVSFGKSKNWLLDTAAFVRETAGADTAVVTNNRTIAYYSGKVANYDDREIRSFTAEDVLAASADDLFALELYFEMSELLADPEITSYLQLLAIFPNDAEPRAAIYRRINP